VAAVATRTRQREDAPRDPAQTSSVAGREQRRTARKSWLVANPAEWRQLGIVGVYLGLLFAMYLHQGVFRSKRLNLLFRGVLSFGALYPASANIPSHNLVHHHFEDDGQPDWAAPDAVRFRWNLLNLIHFPNVAGPQTFNGVQRWKSVLKRKHFTRQYILEQVFAFGLTIALLVNDFWTGLFFVVLPQLYGARCILRINLIQHDRCDIESEWNHSRNFVGRAFNWIMCNNGYHTIHHNKAGLHWSKLAEAHDRDVKPRIDPSLDEPSMVAYLLRTYLLQPFRPSPKDVAMAEREARPTDLASRDTRRAEAAESAGVSGL
jgi:fatty acid desaturase